MNPYRRRLIGAALAAVTLGGCTGDAGQEDESAGEPTSRNGPVAVVRTTSLTWEGEQAYIPLYEDGAASGLVVVNFAEGRLYGTMIPDAWSWLGPDTVEVCGDVNTLRNEIDFEAGERQCAPIPIAGKELDLDEDGEVDLVETVTVLHPRFYDRRPGEGG